MTAPSDRFFSQTMRNQAFTLIELLVVISIIALLIGILLPALGAARSAARSSLSLSNVRQMGIALTVYSAENRGFLPMHSSASSVTPRTRWPDYLYEFMPNTEIYLSPNLTADELERMNKPFAHTVGSGDVKRFGGYGYNFQYLGNSRFDPSIHARLDADILAPSNTVAVGDVAGSRNGNLSNLPGVGGEAVYAIDPPRPGRFADGSLRAHPAGNRAYYANNSSDEGNGNADSYIYRSFPAERNNGAANFFFTDGHGKAMKMAEIDDSNGDGNKDNGLWNGRGNPSFD